jgi:dTDP-4-dehydrorhamnose 3,5-epimerase
VSAQSMELAGLRLVTPRVFPDERGCFFESYSRRRYEEWGIEGDFVQDNVSVSGRGVVRGLHFQNPAPQGKLLAVLHGAVFDVAVDLRVDSPTFGHWEGVELSAQNRHQLWIPPGFAHGFQALSDDAVVAYKCTGYYDADAERALRWDDPAIGIRWPLPQALVSPRDAAAPLLGELPREHLFATPGAADYATSHGRDP